MNMKPTNRRSFFTKLALATGAATLFPRLAQAAPSMGNGTLTGTTTVAPGGTLLIPAGATIQAESGANILGWPTGGGGGDIPPDLIARLDALTPRYAVFEIPFPQAGNFTDFELKGSVNNFIGTGTQALCYFYGSQYGYSSSTHPQIGLTLDTFYTEDLAGTDHSAARRWRRQNPAISIFQQRANSSSRVGGVVVVVPICPANPMITPDNALLTFSYQYVSAGGMDENWRPILPKWLHTPPSPIPWDSCAEYIIGRRRFWVGGFPADLATNFTITFSIYVVISSPGQSVRVVYPAPPENASITYTSSGLHSASWSFPPFSPTTSFGSVYAVPSVGTDSSAIYPTVAIVGISSNPTLPDLPGYIHDAI